MAQIKIKGFEFIPGNNVFFNSSRKLTVDFELILQRAEVNYDKEYVILFSISSLNHNRRELKAEAGSKHIRILMDNNSIPKDHNYTIAADGSLHVANFYISPEIDEKVLMSKNHSNVYYELFITAELHNAHEKKLIGFSESIGKPLYSSKQAS